VAALRVGGGRVVELVAVPTPEPVTGELAGVEDATVLVEVLTRCSISSIASRDAVPGPQQGSRVMASSPVYQTTAS
jgi:hypothetical protein